MTAQSTIEITGLGPVEIKTELNEVVLVGALTTSGDPVNCKTKKVSRNQKAANQAAKITTAWLKEVKPGHFMLIEDNA
jgi:hypothetical protein